MNIQNVTLNVLYIVYELCCIILIPNQPPQPKTPQHDLST